MDKEDEFRARVKTALKSDLYKAQRMYYLSQKLEDRVPFSVRLYCKGVVNKYTKVAKDLELKLTIEELYDRLLDK